MFKKIMILCSLSTLAFSLNNHNGILLRYKNDGIRYVRFTFSDPLSSTLRSVVRPIAYAQDDLEHGIKIDGSSLPGCNRIAQSDMLIKPDIETVSSSLPWTSEGMRSISITCDLCNETGTPYEADPRAILKREMARAEAMGFKFIVGPELEFYILEQNEHKPFDTQGYFTTTTNWNLENALTEILEIVNFMGFKAEKIHHEVAPGQYEFPLEADHALKIADALVNVKHALRGLIGQWQKDITFMPKPFADQNGSGLHLNFSLVDIQTGANAFSRQDGSLALSKTAEEFIAGVLKHARELTLLFNPGINSYKRLVPGFEAPIYICCGERNRSSLIRIPQPTNDRTVRAELRSPDALCNPYLAFAALLKAGLEGIENHYEMPSAVEENLYALDTQEIRNRGIETLPTSLAESLTAFAESDFAHDLLGDRLYTELIKAKTKECAAFTTAVTDWELAYYKHH